VRVSKSATNLWRAARVCYLDFMTDADALATMATWDQRYAGFQKLWKLRMPMPDQVQTVWIFGGNLATIFTVVVVGETHAPLALSVPDWDSARKSDREREHDVLMLYVGWVLWNKRSMEAPSEKMVAIAEQAAGKEAKHPQVKSADVLEIVHVKGFGGTHVTLQRTWHDGRVDFINKSGRMLTPNPKILAVNAHHPTWRFLALEFLPRRSMKQIGWQLP
jgi:hypothetical protein